MNIKFLIPLTIILFFLLIVGPIASFADEDTGGAPSSQQLQGFNLNGYSNAGVKTWDVNGTKADISDENIKITNVDANFYGNEELNLKADHGIINKVNGNVDLKDNVIITSMNRGTQMTTDSLNYVHNKDLVTTQDPVKIVDDQGVVTGQGMIAHPNIKKAQINKNVKAVVNTQGQGDPDNQTVTITSDGPMQMNQVTMYAVFKDHVISVDPSTGRELHCDKMEVWFDQATKKIKKAICTGHAKAIQGADISYADKMVYDGKTQVLTMIGHPKIIFVSTGAKGKGMLGALGGGKKKDKSKETSRESDPDD